VVRSLRFALILASAAPAILAAQAPRQIKLKPADAKPQEEFTMVGSVRELSDGRVLLNDAREGRVIALDMKTGTVTPVGRQGKGPGEYNMAAPVRQMAGDSSVIFDILARRWLFLDGAKIVVTLPPDTPIVTAMKGYAMAADVRGNVWRTETPATQQGGSNDQNWKPGVLEVGAKDSSFVVRGNRASGRVDTVAKIRQPISRQTVRTKPDGKFESVSWSRPPLSVGEEVAYFADGSIAIARLDPYRVDFISPDGKVQKGAPIQQALIKITQREKEAYFERQRAANPGGNANLPEQLRRDMEAQKDQFPENFPPFVSLGVIAAEDGQVLLRKPLTADYPDDRYDIVDRAGRLFGTLQLAKGERIVGVSKKFVYVTWKDDDDIMRLRRHPWMQFDPIKAP
jgi:hypothetical protein